MVWFTSSSLSIVKNTRSKQDHWAPKISTVGAKRALKIDRGRETVLDLLVLGDRMDFALELSDDDTLADLAARSEQLLQETSAAVNGGGVGVMAPVKIEPPTFNYVAHRNAMYQSTHEPIVLIDDDDDDSDTADDGDDDALAPTQLQEDDDDDDVDENMDGGEGEDDQLDSTLAIDGDDERTDVEEEPSVASVHVDDVEDARVEKDTSPMRVSAVLNAAPSPVRVSPLKKPAKNSTTVEKLVDKLVSEDEAEAESESESKSSAVSKFNKVLGAVWDMLEQRGWQVAQGRETLFCAMPGTQFFNFRPNVNVFDSKDKACWKFIAEAAKLPDGDEHDSAELWEALWGVAERKFGWYTMVCGPETWFVKPDTRFEEFKPNETIFQTKKRAALKCLAVARVVVELGDSVEGHQVIDFAPRVVAMKKEATPAKPKAAASSSSFAATPSPALKAKSKPMSSSSSSSLGATKASPPVSSTKSRAKVTPPKPAAKAASKPGKKASASKKPATGTKKKKPALPPSSAPSASSTPISTHIFVPEFRCSFGIVYKRLQDLGWYHRPGKFEYDYFSPEYTPETAAMNVNYFHSTAEFEEYLKECGLWHKIERMLRVEHAEEVEVLRNEARERVARQLERREKKQRLADEMRATAEAEDEAFALEAAETAAASAAAEKSAREAEAAAVRARDEAQKRVATVKVFESASRPKASPSAFAGDLLTEYRVTIGKVVGKLLKRGWTYRPGRFEYDYFKPGVTPKNATLNEDYFQSEAELETHLKITGLWDEISRELRDEHFKSQEREAMRASQEQANAVRQVKRSSVGDGEEESPKRLRTDAAAPSPSLAALRPQTIIHKLSRPSSPRAPQIDAEEAEELTNDIWANSHHFTFDR